MQYPDSNEISILGPVYLPSLYAKDLDALTIASSGKISIFLNDVAAFDIVSLSNVTTFVPQPGTSLDFGNSSNAHILVDPTANSILIKGQDITFDGNINIINNHNTQNNFIFRANQYNELELLKVIGGTSNVVARFGRKLVL